MTTSEERAYIRRRRPKRQRNRKTATLLFCCAALTTTSYSDAFQFPFFQRKSGRSRSTTATKLPPSAISPELQQQFQQQQQQTARSYNRRRILKSTVQNTTDTTTTTTPTKQHQKLEQETLPPVSSSHWKAFTTTTTTTTTSKYDSNTPINVVGIDHVFEDLLNQKNGHRNNGQSQQQRRPSAIETSDWLAASLMSDQDDDSTAEMFFAKWVDDDPNQQQDEKDSSTTTTLPSVRSLWKRRHARSIQEGIRREHIADNDSISETHHQLSSLLSRAHKMATSSANTPESRQYAARTIAGLINALAEEADDVKVQVDANPNTPLWDKHVDSIRINFSRLGFKPIRMGGGLDKMIQKLESNMDESHKTQVADNLQEMKVSSADEAFDRMDVDKSGALDRDEIANALNLAAYDMSDANLLEDLASELVELYDTNGDGVVDREEYDNLVADMASLRQEEQRKRLEQQQQQQQQLEQQESSSTTTATSWLRGMMGRVFRTVLRRTSEVTDAVAEARAHHHGANATDVVVETAEARGEEEKALDDITSESLVQSVAKGAGSILLSDLRLDLRQILFGFIPLVKRVTPGGPLILEPFRATLTGSFNSQDIQESFLLDAGLRRLTARALRVRIRNIRDFMDGAVFYGRNWNMASKHAPKVEIPRLTSVEFDKQDRLIMTGIAQVQYSPETPVVENKFKVRTRIGTRKDGQLIRLEKPELAFVLECPKSWERNVEKAYKALDMAPPKRPDPLYSFFPIYSPFKLDDNSGFDLGPDNCIKSIFIKDGALRFEVSAILRPGRFLGSHYLAFTIPQRTFIITMDKVREGIKTARRNKKAALAAAQARKANAYTTALAKSLSSHEELEPKKHELQNHEEKKNIVKVQPSNGARKSFFSRFVEGYTGAGKEETDRNARLTIAISDWFGRQGNHNDDDVFPRRREV